MSIADRAEIGQADYDTIQADTRMIINAQGCPSQLLFMLSIAHPDLIHWWNNIGSKELSPASICLARLDFGRCRFAAARAATPFLHRPGMDTSMQGHLAGPPVARSPGAPSGFDADEAQTVTAPALPVSGSRADAASSSDPQPLPQLAAIAPTAQAAHAAAVAADHSHRQSGTEQKVNDDSHAAAASALRPAAAAAAASPPLILADSGDESDRAPSAASSASSAGTGSEAHAAAAADVRSYLGDLGSASSPLAIDSDGDDAAEAEEAAAALAETAATQGTDVEDDDELTILAVRRALHIPLRPQRHPRVVHSPVNLLDSDDDEPAAAAPASSSAAAAAAAAAATSGGGGEDEDEDGDVCAICLSTPSDLSIPSSCSHPFCFSQSRRAEWLHQHACFSFQCARLIVAAVTHIRLCARVCIYAATSQTVCHSGPRSSWPPFIKRKRKQR